MIFLLYVVSLIYNGSQVSINVIRNREIVHPCGNAAPRESEYFVVLVPLSLKPNPRLDN